MAAHEFTYANIGHGDKDLIISACACGASRILAHVGSGKRYEWRVIEQIGTLPACTCPPDEDEDTMHPIEGFHATAHSLECCTDDEE